MSNKPSQTQSISQTEDSPQDQQQARQAQEHHLFAGLNQIQCQAVSYIDGPLLLVAGAGSGKTRVITHRIAYLIGECQVAPWNIAAVTFTNKAAQEMRQRLEKLIGRRASNVFVRTFHSLGLYVLSRHAETLGLESGFSIIDQNAQKSLLKTILKEEKMESPSLQPAAVANQINSARDAMMSPRDIEKTSNVQAQDWAHLYRTYIKRLRKINSLDFGDLLYETVRLFEKNKDIRANYANLWRHFMIDEYQDTNHTQYLLGKMIANEHKNIMVVGDDDQSIYSWRGADIENILSFEKDYPMVKVMRLEENYRSSPQILKAASTLISHNQTRRRKTIFTKKPDASPIFLQAYHDENEEARGIVQQMMAYRDQGIPLNQMAIFYRTNAQSRIFERVLREKNLPYIIVGDIRFYERKEIKDLLAYLSVIVNPQDDLSLERIINVPVRGIGKSTLANLYEQARQDGQSLFEALAKNAQNPKVRSAAKLGTLHKMFLDWQSLHQNGESPALIAERVIQDSGYVDALKKDLSYEAAGRLENLYECIASIRQYEQESQEGLAGAYDLNATVQPWEFDEKMSSSENKAANGSGDANTKPQVSLGDFLQQISLYTDERSTDDDRNSYVSLMTLHNAKGLEFPCVFLCGLEENYLPHSLSVNEGNIEEERRLLYVGITRAQDYLHLSYANQRWIFGNLQSRFRSPFIEEMDNIK